MKRRTPNVERRNYRESGQALLIAVFIGLLLLITIPVVVFVNTTGVLHRVAAENRDKGTNIAEEGLAYTKQLFAIFFNPALNPNALAFTLTRPSFTPASYGTLWTNTTVLPVECESSANGTDIIDVDGSRFRLRCGTLASGTCPTCQPYEIYVQSTAYLPTTEGTAARPSRTVAAYFSQKTLAATLPRGFVAPACLILVTPTIPTYTGADLKVDWGPVVVDDLSPEPPIFKLSSSMNTSHAPRKFALGGIDPRSINPLALPTSDGKEYWAYTSLELPQVINLGAYQILAQNMKAPTVIVPAVSCVHDSDGSADGVPLPQNVACGGVQCGYFNTVTDCPSNDRILFDGGAGDWTLASAGGAIYVNGDAEFRNVAIDLRPQGAVIVNGNMTIGQRRDISGNSIPNELVPPTAALEYPSLGAMPGGCRPGTTCNLANWSNPALFSQISIRGFVYVTGGMSVVAHFPVSVNNDTAIAGVLRVDGQLNVQPGVTLNLYYDDVINRNIQTANFQMMVDSQTEISAQ